jgi:hypothetical protein
MHVTIISHPIITNLKLLVKWRNIKHTDPSMHTKTLNAKMSLNVKFNGWQSAVNHNFRKTLPYYPLTPKYEPPPPLPNLDLYYSGPFSQNTELDIRKYTTWNPTRTQRLRSSNYQPTAPVETNLHTMSLPPLHNPPPPHYTKTTDSSASY